MVRLVEVFVLALVLPGKVASLPHICPALPATLLARPGLKGEGLAAGIGLCRGVVTDQVSEVDKVLLSGRAFLERGLAPFGDELLSREGR